MNLKKYLTGMAAYSPAPNTCRIKLNTNESPYDLREDIKEEIIDQIRQVKFNRYPNPRCVDLCKAAADFYGIETNQIMAANGSGEWLKFIISDLMEAGSKLLFLDPDFFIYRRQAGFVQCESKIVQKGETGYYTAEQVCDLLKTEKPDFFIFSNPCNPTGQGYPLEDVKKIVAAAGDAVVVVDEAYNDFMQETCIPWAVTQENVIVLRTCSKAVGLASARVGFVVSNPYLVDLVNHIRSPYSVSQYDQIIATTVLKHKDWVKEITQKVIDDREVLYQGFCALADKYPDQMQKPHNSLSNAFMVIFTDNTKVTNELKEKYGISIRNFPNSCIPHTRINVGTAEEDQELLDALDEILAQG